METTKLGWHFTGNTLRDGSAIPPVGEWLEFDGPIVPCASGLHMSEHPIDALKYAPGNLLHRVELAGELKSHGTPIDKWCGSKRRIVQSVDAEPILREFARWCALQVIDLWTPPDVVVEYLKTGNESLRDAAWDAAWDAARAAAWDAACAAWDAARAAARDAARAAARDAAWAAARDAAREAARDAAWAAARAAQRNKFNYMVLCAFTLTQ